MRKVELLLKRTWKNRKLGSRVYCVDEIFIDGKFFFNIMEDEDRGLTQSMTLAEIKKIKVPSLTAIPTGRYKVTTSVQSPKFSNYTKYPWAKEFGGCLPRLLDVPAFDGILIHPGTDERSSAGCLITGKNTYKGGLTQSLACFRELYKQIKGTDCWITVV